MDPHNGPDGAHDDPGMGRRDRGRSRTYRITITNASGTYKAYQVFQGDLTQDATDATTKKTILSNVAWGSGVTAFEYSIGTDKKTNDAKEIAAYLTGKGDEEAKKFAAEAANHIISSEDTPTAQSNSGKAELTGLPAGYYLILNSKEEGDGQVEALSSLILQVTADQEVTNKAEVPSFEKKVKDKNDTTGIESDWQDSADYDIGDEIPFKLEGTVAANYGDYKGAYKFVFHDQEENGLTFNPDTVKVFVDGTEITTGFKVETTTATDGCTFEVVFENLKKIEGVEANSRIVVTYTSKLNENAVLGKTGNVNKAKLEFSNNPNADQTGETPWDNVIVFTYQLVVNKYANEVAEENRLAGAEFTLVKKLSNNETKKIAVVKSEAGKVFTFKGLDDGTYILTETTTPSGFNTIDPIEFTVSADHEISWTTGGRDTILKKLSGNKADGTITFTPNEDKSELSTNVINKSGTTLPETGGIGTGIFYLVGGVLMAGAAILLIVKKRMGSEK